MNKLIRYGLFLFYVLSCLSIPQALAETSKVEDGDDIIRLVLGDRTPLTYQPFTVAEVKGMADEDPDDAVSVITEGGVTYLLFDLSIKGDDPLEVEVKEPFKIEINEYVKTANQLEQQITPYGYSLRDESFEQLPVDIYALFNDPETMRKRLLEALELYAKEELLRRLDAIDPGQCPQIDVDKLVTKINLRADDIADKHGLKIDHKYRLNSGDLTKFDDYIRGINNTSKILCALGYNLPGAMGLKVVDENGVAKIDEDSILAILGNGSDLQAIVSYLESKISDAFQGLGLPIPGSDSILSWAPLQEAMSWASELLEIDDFEVKLKMPSPEFIKAKISELGLDLPQNLDMPDFPVISFNKSFEPPTREDLVLKKRKDWNGFDLGNRKVIGAQAKAYYEIRGSEEVQWGVAVGRADVFLLGQTKNAIGAYAQAEAGPNLLEFNTDIQVLGMQLAKFNQRKTTDVLKYEKELLGSGDGYSYNYAYTQQFAIGPIPVYVSIGVYASANAKFGAGLTFTQVYAELVPMAKAGAFGEGAVGVKKVLSVGVKGDVDVLNLSAPLRGKAGLFFAQNGEPFLKLALTSDAFVRALNGKISAFVEYPWLSICKKKILGVKIPYPCIKAKKKSKTLFSYGGYVWNKSIMNWGLTYGYQGVHISGSMLDQTDRKEAAALQGKVDLYQRHLALEDYSQKTEARINEVFNLVKNTLTEEATTLLPQKDAALRVQFKNAQDNIEQYESWLLSSIENSTQRTIVAEQKSRVTKEWLAESSVDTSPAVSSEQQAAQNDAAVLRSLHGFLF
ncbi:hypothetical protein [Photobacterium galatheae]|uniref:hypothetical protein n=1 Tax=Photobacterium galatheae TaxID=1654360 RepID=UPI001267F558|nr:hypothetical protein [Photobacterium galatheae]MCM0150889.1 hypothetical protein [Photobacterium galatheae]